MRNSRKKHFGHWIRWADKNVCEHAQTVELCNALPLSHDSCANLQDISWIWSEITTLIQQSVINKSCLDLQEAETCF